MSQYVTYSEFLNSPYGSDYEPGESIFKDVNDIDEFLKAISGFIDMYCGRSFDVAEYTQEITDSDRDFIYLDVIPASGVTSIAFENISGSSSGVLDPSTYRLNKTTGKIRLTGKLNPDLIYTVTYTAGYGEVPIPIKQATLMWANIAAQSVDNGSVAIADGGAVTEFRFNKFWEGYTDPRQRELPTGFPPTVENILKRYKYMKGR